jgi:hypothetical protein
LDEKSDFLLNNLLVFQGKEVRIVDSDISKEPDRSIKDEMRFDHRFLGAMIPHNLLRYSAVRKGGIIQQLQGEGARSYSKTPTTESKTINGWCGAREGLRAFPPAETACHSNSDPRWPTPDNQDSTSFYGEGNLSIRS